MSKKLKVFISSLLLALGVFLFIGANTVKTHASPNWELRSDGFAYWVGGWSRDGQIIRTPNGEDLFYRYEGKDWTRVPDANQYLPTTVVDHSKTTVKVTGTSYYIYELFQTKYYNMSSSEEFRYDSFYDRNNTNSFQMRYEADTLPPVITGPTQIITPSDVALTNAEILAKFNVVDNEDTAPTLSIITNNYAANSSVPGSYSVILQAQDASGNQVTKTINVIVTDPNSPTITGPSEIVVSMTEELTDAEILQRFQAKSSGGESINQLMSVDSTLYQAAVPGTYQIEVSVTHTEVTFKMQSQIKVIDDVKPRITGPDSVEFPTLADPTIPTENQIKAMFIAVDNHDANVTLRVVSSTFTFATKPGTYVINLEAVDASGNKATKAVEIIWHDIEEPTISGPQKIYKGTEDALALAEFLQYFFATDNLDPDIKVEINEDDYTGNGDKAGTYTVKLHASDNSNNYGFKEFDVVVTKKINGFYIVEDEIFVSKNYKLTKTDVATFLELTRGIKLQDGDKFDVVLNDYEKNADKVNSKGTIFVTLTRKSGQRYQVEIKTNVVESAPFNLVDPGARANETKNIIVTVVVVVVVFAIVVVVARNSLGKRRRRR